MKAHDPFPSLPSAQGEDDYSRWLRERQLPMALRILGFVAFCIVGFAAWDAWLSLASIGETWPLRALSLAFIGVCALMLGFTGVARYWRTVALIASCTLFCLLLLILMRLPDGALLGSGGLLLSAFLLRVHSARIAMVATLFNALALAVVYSLWQVDARVLINTEIFLFIASAGNILLNFSDERGDRQKFDLERQLKKLATTDGLTGAANRRHLSDTLTHECERADRYGHDLTLILLDIDRFKAVNDTRGHGDGDQALRAIAAIGIESGRASDTFARLGGEEFVMLLPHTDLNAGIAFAERLRARIAAEKIAGAGGQFSVTASFGVAGLKRGESGDALVARADAALYMAKQAGRNRVVSERELQLAQAA